MRRQVDKAPSPVTVFVGRAGDVFHMPPGHDPVFTETGCLIVEFSPATELAAFMEEAAPLLAQ